MIFSSIILGQDISTEAEEIHSVSIKTQFLQIKDEFNYGLVFSGINLVAGYKFECISEKNAFEYSPETSFGGIFNKGAGFVWGFNRLIFTMDLS